MKRYLTALVMGITLITSNLNAQSIYPGKATPPEENVSAEFNYESKFVSVNNNEIHYVESGQGEPILFLHGIPTWSYLWRNVIDEVDGNKRAIALDFLGYGKSELPQDGNVSFEAQLAMLEGFIEKMNMGKVTLVVNDLGSLVGLYYATKHPEKIKGVVMIEAAFMPARDWFKQLTTKQKMMIWMMRGDKMANKFLIKRNPTAMMMKQFTKRKLSEEEFAAYAEPFEDVNRRPVIMNGPGPRTFPKKMKSKAPGDMADIINTYAPKLTEVTYPIHLIYAKKGLITRKKAVKYARENFKNYSEQYIGQGKHFLPESHPKAIGASINDWYKTIR
ncbi:haloalkane dehalogenase [Croceitalea sp. MTPC5]|uniref:alpha/beta fold hydrolase n=1 Tax=Croceitalea sp. MTPC5 TaxID=3056565 RepID=UPI002B375D61|nr:haloalkane dehalogenase [Croceitalea sp. MTPC5]